MKKIVVFVLAFALCLGIGACGAKTAWTVEDFSIFDDKGNEVDFPTAHPVSLSNVNEEKDGDFQTHRGVKIGMRATTAMEKYSDDLTYFYWAIQRYRSPTDDEKAENKKLHDKYKTLQEIIAASPDFLKNKEVLWISAYFYETENGDILPYPLDDLGHKIKSDEIKSKTDYEIIVLIQNEKVKDIEFQMWKN